MNKNRFDFSLMGRKVVVTKVYKRNVTWNNQSYDVEWEAEETEHRCGWIVGYRWLNNGKIFPAHGRFDDFDPSKFKLKNKIFSILVTYWPTQNPIYVPMDGYIFNEDEFYFEPLYTSSGYGDGQNRKHQLNLMKKDCMRWPRDSKGRFVKINR